ncbi:DoxX family protein [Dinghuibacter silviterrae]|uniref:DoxX-like protein n=1 Tax=Dinghuibacter silviterrae TaxID=1539049 RepID=A0A4R8DF19_9BACT|nr:DoxX family protein [Dinghuibacter silviterrae]TDW96173.1 DoxX-like protein [Dinghuibacter silviterrae]
MYKRAFRAGWILTGLCLLFLFFDAAMKIVREIHTIQASAKIGWPADLTQGLGVILLLCTLIYAYPRTAVLGALLVTAYLGGAVAIMVRVGENFVFPLIFAALMWTGLYLRDPRLRSLFPWTKA